MNVYYYELGRDIYIYVCTLANFNSHQLTERKSTSSVKRHMSILFGYEKNQWH